MHDGKKQFLIMMEEQSYLAQSFQSAFEKHEMNTSIVNIAATSAIVNQEHPIGYLICASSELLKKTVGIKIMVDHDMKKVAVERAEEHIKTNLAEYLEKGVIK